MNQAKQWITEHYDEMIADLRQLIRIESVQGEPQPGMPFGKEVDDALNFVGELSRKLGFVFHNVDGYIGYFDYAEEPGVPEYGAITHIDVVPPRKGSYPSFDLTQVCERYYGRGSLDDKGPTVILLYALAALKATGFQPNKNIRMLVGTNEESGWQDIAYVKDKGIIPQFGFSPDADYPVINGEKGGVQFELSREHNSNKVVSAESGDRPNMVPDRAVCVVKMHHEEVTTLCSRMTLDTKIQDLGNGLTQLTFFGKSAHASMPELGVNAAKTMLEFLCRLDSSFLAVRSLFRGHNGFGLGFVDDELTLNLGAIHYHEGNLQLIGDIRFPRRYTVEECKKTIESGTRIYEIEYIHAMEPHFVEENSPLVQALLQAYQQETGQSGYAFTIGGGTFARAFQQGVAFGCLFPGEEMTAHQADEYIAVDSFRKNINIMIAAIMELIQ